MSEEKETPSVDLKKDTYAKDLLALLGSDIKFLEDSQKFYSFEVSSDEVIECFLSQDSLSKIEAFIGIFNPQSSLRTDFGEYVIKRNQETAGRYRLGAALIIANIFDPSKLREMKKSYYEQLEKDKDSEGSSTQPIELCLGVNDAKLGEKENLSTEELQQLSVAGSMLIASAKMIIPKESTMNYTKDAKQRINELGIFFYPLKIRDDSWYQGLKILEEVFTRGVSSNDPEQRLIGLKAGWEWYGNVLLTLLNPSYRTKQVKNAGNERKKLILNMVDDLESVFLRDNGVLYNEGFKKGSRSLLKGTLHELIWLLDFLMLSEIAKDRQGILPSLPFEDKPKDTETEFYRGFDYVVYFGDTSENECLIQLKSNSGRNQKEYDELIELLEEENFMDIEPRRLWVKLNYYRQLIACNFEEKFAPNPEKYILPTVYEAKERIRKIGKKSLWERTAEQIGVKFYGHPSDQEIKMNREQRRLNAKKAKRKKANNATP